MSLNLETINQQRHPFSAAVSMCLVALVVFMAQSIKGPAELVAQEVMELTTTLIEPLLQKPAPVPEIRPETKQKSFTPTPTTTPPVRQELKQEAMAPAETARPVPAVSQTMTPIAPTAAVAPVTQAIPESPKPVAPQVPVNLSLENNYIANVRRPISVIQRVEKPACKDPLAK